MGQKFVNINDNFLQTLNVSTSASSLNIGIKKKAV